MDKGNKSPELKIKLAELQQLIHKYVELGKDLSVIEKDLALQKTRELYELLVNLDEHQPSVTSGKNPEHKVDADVSSVKVEEEIQASQTDTTEIDTSEIVLISDKEKASKIDQKPESHDDDPDLFTASSPSKTKQPKEKPAPTQESIGDIFSETQEKEIIADKMQKDKIISLNIAIGINDKFYFINELFDGSLNDYNAAIEKLDTASSLKDARGQFDKMGSDNNWDSETEAVRQLLGFIERKYS